MMVRLEIEPVEQVQLLNRNNNPFIKASSHTVGAHLRPTSTSLHVKYPLHEYVLSKVAIVALLPSIYNVFLVFCGDVLGVGARLNTDWQRGAAFPFLATRGRFSLTWLPASE
jgi:hypothetical protein